MADNWRGAQITLLLFCLAGAGGCRPGGPSPAPPEKAPEEQWFVDVAEAVGLDFVHDPGPTDGSHFLPQIMGSGAALFDMENRGRLDIYLINNGGPEGSRNRLFRQRSDGTFEDVSAGSGLDVAGYGMGIAVGDVNNDGLPDVYLTCYGGDRLFLNQGHGRFKEVTKEAGIDNALWGTAVSFVDYDRDGWLDLVVVNYLAYDPTHPCLDSGGRRAYCHPHTFPGAIARLYHNRGRDASGKWLGFEDRSGPSGLAGAPGPGLGVLCADFNGDGWPDIFVANDAAANHLWINQKDGTFKEEAIVRGLAYNAAGRAQGNMGVAYGDVDGNGLCALFVTHMTHENHGRWKQGLRGLFEERAALSGLTQGQWRGTGFGTTLADFDHDGALDLAVVNGRVGRAFQELTPYWKPYAERNQLFANDGRGNFRDVSQHNPAFCGWAGVSRGLAVGDVDGDGALDLLVTQVGGRARLFRNVAPKQGNWLMVQALENVARRDAIGAEVRVHAGARHWVRLIQPGHSYLCSNDPQAHFGLGELDHVDKITVTWPDGIEEVFPGGPVNRRVVLTKGQGQLGEKRKEDP
jgi:enediyne biosynthesis protein E4